MQSFYSNGKFLLTGEYLVLEGAKALALPLKFGQELKVMQGVDHASKIEWKTYVRGTLWFQSVFDNTSLKIMQSSDNIKAEQLRKILEQASKLNPEFLTPEKSYKIDSIINFDINWGLGSSSSLISNIAYWAKVDPYELHFSVSGGSGYDIASARATGPLVYQLINSEPKIEKVSFEPEFRDYIYYIYTGIKQSSEQSILDFNKRKNITLKQVETISEMTNEILNVTSLDDFNNIIKEHEKYVSQILSVQPVKEYSFHNFDGEIKSLGAWGGDFVLATWKGTKEKLLKYFSDRNLNTVFTFDDIILNSENN